MGYTVSNPYNNAGATWQLPDDDQPVAEGAKEITRLGNNVANQLKILEGKITSGGGTSTTSIPSTAVTHPNPGHTATGSGPANDNTVNGTLLYYRDWINNVKLWNTPLFVHIHFDRPANYAHKKYEYWYFDFVNINSGAPSWTPHGVIGKSNFVLNWDKWDVWQTSTSPNKFRFIVTTTEAYTSGAAVEKHQYVAVLTGMPGTGSSQSGVISSGSRAAQHMAVRNDLVPDPMVPGQNVPVGSPYVIDFSAALPRTQAWVTTDGGIHISLDAAMSNPGVNH